VRCPIESQENLELLVDYGSATVASEAGAAFGQHLEVCARCREVVAGQEAVRWALDVWEAPAVSPSFTRHLYERIERSPAWRERLGETASHLVRLLLVWRGVPIAAAACLIVTAGIMIEQSPLGLRLHKDRMPNAQVLQRETTQPDEQVVDELDDMEMLGNFDRSVRAGAKPEL
jgi:hypothetical protein